MSPLPGGWIINIRDRIKQLIRVKGSELRPNPLNWRTHPPEQADAMRGILAEIGFAGAALARRLPDGSLMLIDGHLRAETAPDAEIPVLELDVTEEEAAKILATYDPIGALAGANAANLEATLKMAQFESPAVTQMLSELAQDNGLLLNGLPAAAPVNDPNAEWVGMPEYGSEDLTPAHKITVYFPTLEACAAFSALIGQAVNEKTKWVWYPPRPPVEQVRWVGGVDGSEPPDAPLGDDIEDGGPGGESETPPPEAFGPNGEPVEVEAP